MIVNRTRERLYKFLRERNEQPERAAEIDAHIRKVFGETLAVLVMDMSGFSRQTVRHGIIHFLAKIQRMHSIAIPAVEAHEGVIIKLEADNVYAVFGRVADAVEAAVDIQCGLDSANALLPDELDMHGEYGIGFGEILVIEGEDIFGSEVNLASKLGEDLAERGEILLTESAHQQVAGREREFERLEVAISGLELVVYKVKNTSA
ncbi:MAG TPA: adenylate/guanylate cyclase domain-containing protein [Pyrinomonadaceae bacterium]|nr:adenylate/guanylate cyclase domain-containing protein [Pyrinomonadaceae bacterium]